MSWRMFGYNFGIRRWRSLDKTFSLVFGFEFRLKHGMGRIHFAMWSWIIEWWKA
jgi:hypothetical protein